MNYLAVCFVSTVWFVCACREDLRFSLSGAGRNINKVHGKITWCYFLLDGHSAKRSFRGAI